LFVGGAGLKTLILGLGNPLHCDDGVGNKIAQVLEKEIHNSKVTVVETNAIGIGLLDFLPGYDRAIIIDAIQTPKGKVGQIHRLGLQDLATYDCSTTTHNLGLGTVVELGTKLGLALPKEIVILAIEVADVTTFRQDLTPKVKQAIPKLVKLVLREIEG
jgi:hydrogenase maturation protease